MALFNMMARLGLNTAQFDSGLKRAESGAARFGKTVKASLAGAFSTAAVLSGLRAISSFVGGIKDMSSQMRISTDDVQILQRKLEDAGLSLSGFQSVMNKVNDAREKSILGNEQLAKSFALFGVSMDDLTGANDALDLIRILSTGLKDVGMTAETSAALMSILGNESRKYLEIITGINEMPDMPIASKETLNNLDSLSKKLSHVKKDLLTMSATGLDKALGALADLGDKEISKFALPLMLPGVLGRFLKGHGFGTQPEMLGPPVPSTVGTTKPDFLGPPVPEGFDWPGPPAGSTGPDPKRSFSPMHRDSITSMGGLFTGGDAQLRMIPAQQLTEMKGIHERLRSIEARVEQAAQ